ncbi:MAG: mobile mystery protein A [Flavobacteriales bacterium]|nr:mobile mystery protein A [Flavobacteriales bacterium]
MSSQHKLRISQLEEKLQLFNAIREIQTPNKGWVHSIRTTLNMTLRQLGNKLNMSEQGARDLENREASGSISLRSLQEAANAMDMKFVYGLVPKDGTLEQLVERKARVLAEKIVRRTHHNMQLEDQGNSEERIAAAIDELTDEIKRELRRSIWD